MTKKTDPKQKKPTTKPAKAPKAPKVRKAPAEAKPDLRKLPKTQRPPPTSGQSGTPIKVTWADLNGDERTVLKTLAQTGRATVLAITTLMCGEPNGLAAEQVGARKLRVRNSLRRLVRGQLVSREDRALYVVTVFGKEAAAAALDGKPVLAKPATEGETGARTLARWRAFVREAAPDLGPEDAKTALVVLGVAEGLGDSKIHAITNLSRGFAISRRKRLLDAKLTERVKDADDLRARVRAATNGDAA